MNKKMLSIIIPMYNGEKTIEKCIGSILKSGIDDKEIICVDDGSVDNTVKICENLKKQYSCIRIIKQDNKGIAGARNTGLNASNGMYVTFMDQDDWLDCNAYSYLFGRLNNRNADMIVFGYYKDYEDRIASMNNSLDIPEEIISESDLIRYAFYREKYRAYAAFVWNKIFKKSFLESNKLRFDEDLLRGDDVVFYTRVAICKPYTVYINRSFYHYFQRKNSVTHTFTEQNMVRLCDILSAYDRAIDLLNNHNFDRTVIAYLETFFVYHASILFELSKKIDCKINVRNFSSDMKKYIDSYRNQNILMPERIQHLEKLIKESENV